jgi:type IV pilus assembly protein PilO
MKQQNLLTYIAISVILAGLFFFVYYRPRSSELQTLKNRRTAAEAEVTKLRQKKKEMDKIEKQLQSLQVDLKGLQAIIPDKREISDILSQFQQLAFNCRLNITKFTPKGETPREFYAEWPIPIEITGNYNNLGIFFDHLSRFSRLFTIDRFTLKALTKQTEAATLSASFTSKTYIFLENPPMPVKTPAKKAGSKVATPAKKGKRGELEDLK